MNTNKGGDKYMSQMIIRHKRGKKDDLPQLLSSELGFTTDEEELYVGTGENNIRLLSEKDLGLFTAEQEKENINTVIFICPGDILTGVQDPHLVIPFDGEIVEATAYVSNSGNEELDIDIQSSTDFDMWNSVLDLPIRILSNTHVDDHLHQVAVKTFTEGTILRLNVPTLSTDVKNLTVNVKVKKQ